MPTKTLAPPTFRDEVHRRLITTFDLMVALGIKNRQTIWNRVEAGRLPPPVILKSHAIAMWDRDEIPELN